MRSKKAGGEHPEGSITFAPEQICRDELDAAIVVFINDLNYVAAHVLAQAAHEVMRGYAKRNQLPLRADINTVLREALGDDAKDVIDVFNAPYNAMKHFNGDDAAKTHPHLIELRLMEACKEYGQLFGHMTPKMALYIGWCMAVTPRLRASLEPTLITAFKSATVEGSRSHQLKEARSILASFGQHPEFQTEYRELFSTKGLVFKDQKL